MGEPNAKSSNFLSRWLHSEFEPSVCHTNFPGFDKTNPEVRLDSGVARWRRRLAVGLTWAADICVYVHWVFGTLLFSSTLFIGTLDAVEVACAYLASALVCRYILVTEFSKFEDRKEGAEEAETTNDCGDVSDNFVTSRTTYVNIAF